MFIIELSLITISAYIFFISLGLLMVFKSEDAILKILGSLIIFILSLSLTLSGLTLIGLLGIFLGIILFFTE